MLNLRFPTLRETILGIILSGLLAFFFGRGCQKKHDLATSSTILAPDVKEKLIIDPRKHTIVIVSRDGTKVSTLPDRPSSIEILNNGKVRVNSPQFGTEIRPFLAGAYTLNGGKLGAGVDLVYYKRVDVGLGFATNPTYVQDTTIFIGVSMFVYSNTSIMLG